MSRPRTKWVLGVAMTLALLLTLGVGSSTVLAGAPTRVSGGGEATAAAFVEYVGHDGVVRKVRSINTAGNRITFGFNAKKDADGNAQGQMQLVDHDLGLAVHSDVNRLRVPHRVHKAVVGEAGLSASMAGATVKINGEDKPGWRMEISPLFDGGEGKNAMDAVCFELFNADGVLVRQWSAILSAGNVQVVP